MLWSKDTGYKTAHVRNRKVEKTVRAKERAFVSVDFWRFCVFPEEEQSKC
jgi:hypothetical protein